jgi:long-chain-fatty-acid--CoA ligase ACSBG
LTKIKQALGLD